MIFKPDLMDLASIRFDSEETRASYEVAEHRWRSVTSQQMASVEHWLQRWQQTEASRPPWSGLHHRLSTELTHLSTDLPSYGRSKSEWDLAQRFAGRVSLWRGSFPTFEADLLAIHASFFEGQSEGFRVEDVFTEVDRSGNQIQYPSSSLIAGQIQQIHQWVRMSPRPTLWASTVLMASLLNVHPFRDGSGRVGRTVFYAVMGAEFGTQMSLPLYEFSHLSNGGFLLSLREAQYFGRWKPLADFLNASVAIVERLATSLAPNEGPA